ncbi:MAG: hypothetical protein ABSA39_21035 [Edaphobacter sp.]
MPKGSFLPSDFLPTEFSTNADNAAFGNTFLHLIGLLGVGIGGDSSPRKIAFQGRIEF